MIPNITTGHDFAGLRRYLVDNERSELIGLDPSALDAMVDQMEMVAGRSSRCLKPLLHLSFSSAIEDGRLSDAEWSELVESAKTELGLKGHDHVLVRHNDKPYDHVHAMICVVSPETGRTPKKQWFSAKTDIVPSAEFRALRPTELKLVPEANRALRAYNFRSLQRMQVLCRAFERARGLRRCRTREEMTAAQKRGETRARKRNREAHKAARAGDSLLLKSKAIRAALNAPTYDARAIALAKSGLGIRSALVTAKGKPDRIRGIVIYELKSSTNSIKASDLDIDGTKYGMGALDKRTASGAPKFVDWIAGYATAADPAEQIDRGWMREMYARRCDAHVHDEERRSRERLLILAEQRAEVAAARAKLMAEQAGQAQTLPAGQRRAFYATFDRDSRMPALLALKQSFSAKLSRLVRRRKPTFSEFRRSYLAGLARVNDLQKKRQSSLAAPGGLHRLGGLQSIPPLHKGSNYAGDIDRSATGRGNAPATVRSLSLRDQAALLVANKPAERVLSDEAPRASHAVIAQKTQTSPHAAGGNALDQDGSASRLGPRVTVPADEPASVSPRAGAATAEPRRAGLHEQASGLVTHGVISKSKGPGDDNRPSRPDKSHGR